MPKTDRSHRWFRLAVSALVLSVMAQVGASLAPQSVAAHAELVDADPAPNSVIPASPSSLALFFSEAIDPATIRLRILGSDQRSVAGLGPVRLDASGRVATAGLPTLEPGTYTVDFAVVSAVDGHPTTQVYAFVVDPTGLAPPPAPGTLPETGTPPDPIAIAARWVATIGTLLLLGTVLVWLLHQRWLGAAGARPAPWLLLASLSVVALLGLTAHLLRAATVVATSTGEPLTGVGLPFDPAAPFGATPFANAMRLALLGSMTALAFATVGWAEARRSRRRGQSPSQRVGRVALVTVGAAGVAIVLGLSLTGHAAALGGPLFAAIDALHLLAIAAWLGALPALTLLAWRDAGRPRREAWRRTFASHAPVALVAAPMVVLTGLANSPLVVGDPRELVAAGYGNLLLTKALLVSVALGLGAANFLVARHRGGRGLVGIVGFEIAVAALAVVVGATMVSVEPATDRPPSTIDPRLGVAHLYGEDGQSAVHGIVDLPEPGVQSYSFAISDPDTGAGREDVSQVVLTFIPPDGSVLPEDVELTLQGSEPWIWELHGAFTPVVGNWEVEVLVRGRLEEDRVVMPLAVRRVLRATPLPPPTTGSQVLAALAAPTSGLPPGPAGWATPIGLLGLAAGLLAYERRRAGSSRPGGRAVRAIRLGVIMAGVAVGISLLARDAVAVANQPPTEWRAAVNPLADDPAAIEAGQAVYRANCASCHGTDGSGDGPMASALTRPPTDLAEIVPHRLDGELAWDIGAGVAGTQMPAFGTALLEGERWALVTYLRSRWPLEIDCCQ